MMRQNMLRILVAALIGAVLTGCGPEKTVSGGREVVAVSIVPEAAFLKEVAGDHVEIATVIPPGSSPESYSPTPQQMVDLSDAKLYFTIGVEAEKAGILDKLAELNKEVVFVDIAGIVGEHYDDLIVEGGRDPHIWLSPKRAIVMVEAMIDAMSELMPEFKEDFAANGEAYIKELESLDEEIGAMFVGKDIQPIIVYHPALGYFADDYGLTMITIESEGKEATAKELEAIIDYAKEEGIDRIFYQKEFDSQQAGIIAGEIGGTAVEIDPLSGDYTRNLKALAQEISK